MASVISSLLLTEPLNGTLTVCQSVLARAVSEKIRALIRKTQFPRYYGRLAERETLLYRLGSELNRAVSNSCVHALCVHVYTTTFTQKMTCDSSLSHTLSLSLSHSHSLTHTLSYLSHLSHLSQCPPLARSLEVGIFGFGILIPCA